MVTKSLQIRSGNNADGNLPEPIDISACQKKKMFERRKDYHRIFNKWRDYDFLTTVFALFGLGFATIYYEHAITDHKGPLDPAKYPNPLDLHRLKGTTNLICKFVTMITTIFAIACLYLR